MVKLPYHSGKEKEKKKPNILGDVKNQITISSRIQEIKKINLWSQFQDFTELTHNCWTLGVANIA